MTENSTEQFEVDREEEVDDVEIYDTPMTFEDIETAPPRADAFGTQDDEVDPDA